MEKKGYEYNDIKYKDEIITIKAFLTIDNYSQKQ